MKLSKSQQPTPRYLNDVISASQFKKIENFKQSSRSIRRVNDITTNISISHNASDYALSRRKESSYIKQKNLQLKEEADNEEIKKLFEILEKDTENPQQMMQRISQSQTTIQRIQELPPINQYAIQQNDPNQKRLEADELIISKMKSEYSRLFPSIEPLISQEKREVRQTDQNDKKRAILSNQSLSQIEKLNKKEHNKLFKSIDLVNNNAFVDFKKMTDDLTTGKKLNLPQEIPNDISGRNLNSPGISTSLISQIKEFVSQKLEPILSTSLKRTTRKKKKVDNSAPTSQPSDQMQKKQKPQYYNKWYIQPEKQYVHKLENLNNLPSQFMETPALVEVRDDHFFYKNIQEGKSSWKQQDPFNQVKQSEEERMQMKLASQEIISRTKVIDDLKIVLNRKGVRVPLFLKGLDDKDF